MRVFPSSSLREFFAEESGTDYIRLFTITFPGVGTRRVCDLWTSYDEATDSYRTISRSQTYSFLPMQWTDPTDKHGEAPRGRIVVDNVSREIIAAFRSATDFPTMTVEFVFPSAPDTVDLSWTGLRIDGIDYNAETISADPAFDLLADELFPAHSMTPATFKGLF